MAQRTEKEETEFNLVPESITPCINNCTLTINPTTAATSTSPATISPAPSPSSPSPRLSATTTTATSSSPATFSVAPPPSSPPPRLSGKSSIRPRLSAAVKLPESVEEVVAEVVAVKREVNRCWGCKRKVGLSGFRCRCGELYCSIHRYSDRHDCSYDYKSAGREAIERENPVVKAAKIVRI